MLVKNWMSKKVITVDVNNSLQGAMELIREHNIRMLPVLKRGNLVGILTERDTKRASASIATSLEVHKPHPPISKIKVQEIMTKDPIAVPLDYTVEETALILLKEKISGAPVVDQEGQVVGIITQSDLFNALISLTGADQGGIQFGFRVEDRPGSVKEVADIIRGYGGRMLSILSTHDDTAVGYRSVYIRMYDIDRNDLPQLIEALSEKITVLYMIDQRKAKREIYTL